MHSVEINVVIGIGFYHRINFPVRFAVGFDDIVSFNIGTEFGVVNFTRVIGVIINPVSGIIHCREIFANYGFLSQSIVVINVFSVGRGYYEILAFNVCFHARKGDRGVVF